jgi:alpha/beta superfamily hydrolase
MGYPKGNLIIQGPVGPLECIIREEEGRASWAVVSHPHPLYGGTMHSKVVYRAARALEETGFNTLRFNFRGVGDSAGTHDGGRGEVDDLRACISYLERERSVRSLLLAGFSFGSVVSGRVGCGDPRVPALLLIGLPANNVDLGFLSSCPKPTAVVQGAQDQFGELSRVIKLVESMPSARLFPVEGADHFFAGKIDELDGVIREAIGHLKDAAIPPG